MTSTATVNAAVTAYREEHNARLTTPPTPGTSWPIDTLDNGLASTANQSDGLIRAINTVGLCPDEAVLDLGCAFGLGTLIIRHKIGPNAVLVAVDLDASLLDFAHELFQRNGDLVPPEFLHADAFDIADLEEHLAGRRFNCIFALGLLPYLVPGNNARVLADWARLLLPEGRIVVDIQHPDGVQARFSFWSRAYGLHRIGAEDGNPVSKELAAYVLADDTAEPVIVERAHELANASQSLELIAEPTALNTWACASGISPTEGLVSRGQWKEVRVTSIAEYLLSRRNLSRDLIRDFDGWVEVVRRRFCEILDPFFRRALDLPPNPAVLHQDSESVRMLAIYRRRNFSAPASQTITKRPVDPSLTGKARKNAINKIRKEEKRQRERAEATATAKTS